MSDQEKTSRERALLAQAQEGDPEAFKQLLRIHQGKILNMALGLTGNMAEAEDLAQETFIRAFRYLGQFRGESAFGTWLVRILINLSSSRYRKLKRMGQVIRSFWKSGEEGSGFPVGEEEKAEDKGPSADPLGTAESKNMGQDIQRAVEELSENQRKVFLLKHQQGLSLKEIGDTMGISEGSVKVHLFRAVRNLRTTLKHWESDL